MECDKRVYSTNLPVLKPVRVAEQRPWNKAGDARFERVSSKYLAWSVRVSRSCVSFIDKRAERTNRLFWKRATDNGNERIETANQKCCMCIDVCMSFTPNYMNIYGPNVILFMVISRSC